MCRTLGLSPGRTEVELKSLTWRGSWGGRHEGLLEEGPKECKPSEWPGLGQERSKFLGDG